MSIVAVIYVARMKRSGIRDDHYSSFPGFRCALSGLHNWTFESVRVAVRGIEFLFIENGAPETIIRPVGPHPFGAAGKAGVLRGSRRLSND